jgi:hypothetical protein
LNTGIKIIVQIGYRYAAKRWLRSGAAKRSNFSSKLLKAITDPIVVTDRVTSVFETPGRA